MTAPDMTAKAREWLGSNPGGFDCLSRSDFDELVGHLSRLLSSVHAEGRTEGLREAVNAVGHHKLPNEIHNMADAYAHHVGIMNAIRALITPGKEAADG